MFDSRKSVQEWNLKCGRKPEQIGSPEFWESMLAQGHMLVEEAKEFLKAAQECDLTELLDAQADVQVVLDGAIYGSQQDHDGAMEAVCLNNDLKYTTSPDIAAKWLPEIEEAKGVKCKIVESMFKGVVYYSVHSLDTGKIMKPVGHPKVNLRPFVVGA